MEKVVKMLKIFFLVVRIYMILIGCLGVHCLSVCLSDISDSIESHSVVGVLVKLTYHVGASCCGKKAIRLLSELGNVY